MGIFFFLLWNINDFKIFECSLYRRIAQGKGGFSNELFLKLQGNSLSKNRTWQWL